MDLACLRETAMTMPYVVVKEMCIPLNLFIERDVVSIQVFFRLPGGEVSSSQAMLAEAVQYIFESTILHKRGETWYEAIRSSEAAALNMYIDCMVSNVRLVRVEEEPDPNRATISIVEVIWRPEEYRIMQALNPHLKGG